MGSEDLHTRNDGQDKRKTEEQERMVIEIPPVKSGQAVLIGFRSKLPRLKYSHDDGSLLCEDGMF